MHRARFVVDVITMDEILRALIETTNEDDGLEELTAGELE